MTATTIARFGPEAISSIPRLWIARLANVLNGALL